MTSVAPALSVFNCSHSAGLFSVTPLARVLAVLDLEVLRLTQLIAQLHHHHLQVNSRRIATPWKLGSQKVATPEMEWHNIRLLCIVMATGIGSADYIEVAYPAYAGRLLTVSSWEMSSISFRPLSSAEWTAIDCNAAGNTKLSD